MCAVSPPFIIVITFIFRNTNGKEVRISNSKQLSDIEFADDLTLLDEDKASLQEFFNSAIDQAEKEGLNINVKKTKCMAVFTNQPLEIFHKDERVKQVSCFRYLGNIVKERGKIVKEIHNRSRWYRVTNEQIRTHTMLPSITEIIKYRVLSWSCTMHARQ